ncbi:hypothetical protein [Methanopyrus sp.]
MDIVLAVAALLPSLISCPVNAAEPVEHPTHGTEPLLDEGRYADHRIDHGRERPIQEFKQTRPEYRAYRTGTGEKVAVREESEEPSDKERGKNRSERRHGGTPKRTPVRGVGWWNARRIGAGVTFGLSLLGALIIWESSRVTSRRRTS